MGELDVEGVDGSFDPLAGGFDGSECNDVFVDVKEVAAEQEHFDALIGAVSNAN